MGSFIAFDPDEVSGAVRCLVQEVAGAVGRGDLQHREAVVADDRRVILEGHAPRGDPPILLVTDLVDHREQPRRLGGDQLRGQLLELPAFLEHAHLTPRTRSTTCCELGWLDRAWREKWESRFSLNWG